MAKDYSWLSPNTCSRAALNVRRVLENGFVTLSFSFDVCVFGERVFSPRDFGRSGHRSKLLIDQSHLWKEEKIRFHDGRERHRPVWETDIPCDRCLGRTPMFVASQKQRLQKQTLEKTRSVCSDLIRIVMLDLITIATFRSATVLSCLWVSAPLFQLQEARNNCFNYVLEKIDFWIFCGSYQLDVESIELNLFSPVRPVLYKSKQSSLATRIVALLTCSSFLHLSTVTWACPNAPAAKISRKSS